MRSTRSQYETLSGHAENPRYSRTSQVREWVGIVLGLLGTVVAFLGYYEAIRSRERSARVEAYQYLDEAWDLLGGQPGTSVIIKPVTDPSKLVAARREIERALILEPDSSKAYRIQGVYFRAAGNLREAIRSLETSIALDPDDYRSHSALGIIYMDAENYSLAEAEFKEAARLEPSNHNILVNLGVLSTKQKRLSNAINYYSQAIKIAPNNEALYNLKGAALRGIGKEQEARSCFARAAEIRNDLALVEELRSGRAKTHNTAARSGC